MGVFANVHWQRICLLRVFNCISLFDLIIKKKKKKNLTNVSNSSGSRRWQLIFPFAYEPRVGVPRFSLTAP